jgi:ribosomal protein S3AE
MCIVLQRHFIYYINEDIQRRMHNMDLNAIIMAQLAELKSEGYVEKVVKDRLKETIKEVVRDMFKPWSDFGKSIEKQIKEQIQINLSVLDIPSYNHMILNVIREELDKAMSQEGAEKIREHIQEILGTAKEEYKLSELIEEMMGYEGEEYLSDLEYGEYHEISLHVNSSYLSSKVEKPWITYIYFDPRSNCAPYDCKYRLVLDENGIVDSVRVEGVKFDNTIIMSGLYGLEKTLFQMYTRGAKLIIDDVETEFCNPEYEE